MDDAATFGRELINRRNQLGLSQSAAAREAGVSRLTWRAWEKDESAPQEYNYVRIEHAMKWQAGSVQLAIAHKRRPIVAPPAPRRIDVDPLRDVGEKNLWAIGKKGKWSDEEIWPYIDEYREWLAGERARIAKEAGEERGRTRRQDSA